jgi:hypothetical protein
MAKRIPPKTQTNRNPQLAISENQQQINTQNKTKIKTYFSKAPNTLLFSTYLTFNFSQHKNKGQRDSTKIKPTNSINNSKPKGQIDMTPMNLTSAEYEPQITTISRVRWFSDGSRNRAPPMASLSLSTLVKMQTSKGDRMDGEKLRERD